MRMEFVEWCDAFVESVDASSALFVPPLIAAPNLSLDFVVGAFDVFLKDEWLAKIKQLSLSTRGL
jgi:hypothetical protein